MNNEYLVVNKEQVCDTIMSFYFEKADKSKVKKAIAGQFLPIKIKLDDGKEVFRTYSVSNKPNDDIYRISVKRVPNGLVSNFLHDNVQIGDKLELNDPCGEFVIKNVEKDEAITLISGGIGITPLLCMLYDESDKRKNISFVQAVQNSEIHPFKTDIKDICDEKGFKNTVFYADPTDNDKKGEDYDVKGYVTKEWIQENTDLNGSFYFCGPPIFMEIIEKILLELGVNKDKIHFEKFS